jgi:membrane fusion protein, multidrug efflux system
MTRRLTILAGLLIGAALAAIAGCQAPAAEEPAPEVPRNVRTMALATSAVTEYFEVAGPILPVRGTDVSAEEGGTVQAIPHDKGAQVRTGSVLVALDRALLAAEVASARANLSLQEYSHDKTAQLFAASKISRLEFLQSQTALEQARATRDAVEVRYERAEVKAPFAGIVSERYVEPGQLVAPGMPVARVIDPFTLKIEAYLTESEVAWIRKGQPAEVVVEGVGDVAPGAVGWVGFEAERASGKFKVEIYIQNPNLALRSGVIARARLEKQTVRDLVVIPRDAIVQGRTGDEVYVVTGDRARRRAVQLGPSQGLMVAVTTGLAPGDQLVVRGQRELQDGSLVTVTEAVGYGDGTSADDPAIIRAPAAGTRVVETRPEAAR